RHARLRTTRGRRVPPLAARAVRIPRRAERRLVHGVLVAAVRRLGGDLPPVATQYLHNPTQRIDFRRFSSDEMLTAFTEQKSEIRAAGSTAPVSTNFMLPTWNHLEQWSWAAEQDVVSVDHYLDSPGPDGDAHVAYGADLTRS